MNMTHLLNVLGGSTRILPKHDYTQLKPTKTVLGSYRVILSAKSFYHFKCSLPIGTMSYFILNTKSFCISMKYFSKFPTLNSLQNLSTHKYPILIVFASPLLSYQIHPRRYHNCMPYFLTKTRSSFSQNSDISESSSLTNGVSVSSVNTLRFVYV